MAANNLNNSNERAFDRTASRNINLMDDSNAPFDPYNEFLVNMRAEHEQLFRERDMLRMMAPVIPELPIMPPEVPRLVPTHAARSNGARRRRNAERRNVAQVVHVAQVHAVQEHEPRAHADDDDDAQVHVPRANVARLQHAAPRNVLHVHVPRVYDIDAPPPYEAPPAYESLDHQVMPPFPMRRRRGPHRVQPRNEQPIVDYRQAGDLPQVGDNNNVIGAQNIEPPALMANMGGGDAQMMFNPMRLLGAGDGPAVTVAQYPPPPPPRVIRPARREPQELRRQRLHMQIMQLCEFLGAQLDTLNVTMDTISEKLSQLQNVLTNSPRNPDGDAI